MREAARGLGVDLDRLGEEEPDAGLGNGGLGRLAACFLDSLATLAIPAVGYGLRYEYGIFRQEVEGGRQVERPDHWLRRPDPWEVDRPAEAVDVRVQCAVRAHGGAPVLIPDAPTVLRGVPYDRPVVGYGGRTVNTLRLWGAAATDAFDFAEFSGGDFFGAVHEKVAAESLTRVLYPDDSTRAGEGLRFAQEHFLVCCSLADIVRRFRRRGNDWKALPDKVAIQLNDTHPALAVAELMRILLDEAGLGWDEAWDLTVRTLAYTNHTLLPEALERWPVRFFEMLAPRLLEIVYEVNRRFLDGVRAESPGDDGLVSRVSLIEEGPEKKVRMAHLAVVGSHSTNGVAALHSRLLRETVLRDLAGLFPARFNNKTNGVTPRRWLLLANPGLSSLLTEAVGDGWVTDLARLQDVVPLADDPSFLRKFRAAKRVAKGRFADWLRSATGEAVDPDSIFDVQVKRIHEYKRQLLNVLHVLVLYNRLREDPGLDVPPRTVFFAGKAAPAYHLAKLIIHLINNVAASIDADPAARGRLKVLFLPEYNVTLAQRLIPASDLSEQISTAGYEASGTSNMKFMMNGALDDRHPRRRHHRDGPSRGGGELLPVRPDRRAGRGQPGVVRPPLARRARARDAPRARTHPLRDVRPRRAGGLHADPRRPHPARRPLHAPGRPVVLREGAGAGRRPLPAARRLGAKGDPQCRALRPFLQRPDDRGVRSRRVGRRALPGGLSMRLRAASLIAQ